MHELLGEEHVGVNLVAEGECESDEDEEWWVGMVRMEEAQEEEVETLEELDKPGQKRRPGTSPVLYLHKERLFRDGG